MKEQLALRIQNDIDIDNLNSYLNNGWKVVSSTAHHISVKNMSTSYNPIIAPILVIIEK